MNGAVVLLIVNAVVAGLFALSYFLIARISRGQRPVIAFGVSYLLGMVTPISEIAIRLTDYPAPFMLASYMALLGGFLAMAAALSIFHRKLPPWTAIAALAVLGLNTRIAIGAGRETISFMSWPSSCPWPSAFSYAAIRRFAPARASSTTAWPGCFS